MKKFLFMLALILPMACCFVSCSSDDGIDEGPIEGCWEVYINSFTPSYVTILEDGSFKMISNEIHNVIYNEIITSRKFYKGTWILEGNTLKLTSNGDIIYQLKNVRVDGSKMHFSYFDNGSQSWKPNGQASSFRELSVSEIEGTWLDDSNDIFGFIGNVISFYPDKKYKWTHSYPNENHGYSRRTITGCIEICGKFIVFTNFEPKVYFSIENASESYLNFKSYYSKSYSDTHSAALKDESYHNRELEWLYTEKKQ